jgi:hypothetical protein
MNGDHPQEPTIAMSSLNRQQSDRLEQYSTGVEQLLAEVDEAGAEEILDELYMLITKVFEQFPQLDKDED